MPETPTTLTDATHTELRALVETRDDELGIGDKVARTFPVCNIKG